MVGSKDLPPSHAIYPVIFFRNQFLTKAQTLPKGTDLSEKVAIITGANTGLGFEAASQLLSYKLSHLIIAVRSAARGDAAAKKLRTRHPQANIEVWIVDMASYESIQTFTRRVETDLARLDIVILNAGLNNPQFRTNPSTGHEEIIQINYISTMLLAVLLLPSLKSKSPRGTPGRLTIVNAALSLNSKLPTLKERPFLQSLDDPKRFAFPAQYCISKTLAHMFLWKLIDHVNADDVIVNLADPAFVKTDLARGLSGGAKIGYHVFGALCGRSIAMGASTFLDAAVAKGKESHGAFIMNYKIHPFNPVLYTPEGKDAIEALWRETLDELAFANVGGILQSLTRFRTLDR
ncbi:hypothetical protein A1O1_00293 [Capronia coronata CBS 617.96]|uniref:Short-chain dehydrogenase/reductase family protein n=1 Tax=Capronia coronata CBS 617.96 TaxID=1182541 RepID=W9ZKX6_9EURO|nr:uncharacterized protein A1O1_00293 [Capronia coronata CBS 617.96]EXJ95174.1 hypothetical protein A1O1_00293 [Capronia coronata CBS 617.96]